MAVDRKITRDMDVTLLVRCADANVFEQRKLEGRLIAKDDTSNTGYADCSSATV
ncbi:MULTISPECIES: hypothetical protein [Bradyrhizobium]|uniref:hypothetical protein n=1 Tax=Bradyrhizobium brasilense TaxID=1419277 RepID=UPI002877FD41|nr:hypothetical protein [Bradyrhizobium brasilense]MCP3413562.1 hypothetical protein [Bradyrhizobium brasilense]